MATSILKNMYTESSLEEAAVRFAASKGDEGAQERVLEMSSGSLPTPPPPSQAAKENKQQTVSRLLCELSMDELWTRIDEERGCALPVYEEIIARLKQQQNNNQQLKSAYEKLLGEFPMCYGYWMRLAKLHATWAEREKVYQRGLDSVEVNPQLWQAYLRDAIDHHSKSNTQIIRDIVDRAIENCGGHWMSWDLWRCCLDFEEAELRRVAEDLSRPNEKLSLEQTTISRLRQFYRLVLQTPHKHLGEAWHKFQCLLTPSTQAKEAKEAGEEEQNDDHRCGLQLQQVTNGQLSLDVTDLLVEQEYDAFQTFVVDHYEIQTNGSWEKCFLKELKRLKNTEDNEVAPTGGGGGGTNTSGGGGDIRVRFPDHSECLVPEGATIGQLRIACSRASGGEDAVDLLVDGCVWHSDVGGLVEDLLAAHTTIVVFDGAALSKALSLSSEKTVEKWFLTRRAELVTQTSAKAIERELYEKKLTRTYYHPNPLTVSQINAWRKYLDFMQAQGDAPGLDLALRRAVEVCCDYTEFWRRAVRFVCKTAGGKEAGRAMCQKAIRLFGQRRPDLIFLYVDFLEKQGELEEAKQITQDALSWRWPVLSDECFVRLLRSARAAKNFAKCEELMEKRRSCPLLMNSSRMCLVAAKHTLTVTRNKQAARAILEEGWSAWPSRPILKQLVWLLQNHFDDPTMTILALYSKAFDALGHWHVWKDLLYYAEHHCDIQIVTQLQARFADFRHNQASSLFPSRKRQGVELNGHNGKKIKESSEEQSLVPYVTKEQTGGRSTQ
eukprot:GHVS01088274.1.p1 GENE.GHVS01088274.1~~GHVS01088274.1.p1  ORF type:complete len:778 (+),score=155.65 GHVS01088274.1:84-2417(+)